jgi:hypothetical protein
MELNDRDGAGVPATTLRTTENRTAQATVKIFIKGFTAATVVGSISGTQANLKKKNRC